MGFFSKTADRPFRLSENGEHLFYLNFPFGKPIILDDEKQKKITYNKLLWMQRISLPLIILALPILNTYVYKGEIYKNHFYVTIHFISLIISYYIIQRIIFRKELSQYKKGKHKLTLKESCLIIANEESFPSLTFGIMGSLIFIILGVWFLLLHGDYKNIIPWLTLSFFGFTGLFFTIAFFSKLNINIILKIRAFSKVAIDKLFNKLVGK